MNTTSHRSHFFFIVCKKIFTIICVIFLEQVTEENLSLMGGVWSLDGTEQLTHSMSAPLKIVGGEDSTSDEEPKAKVSKTSISYCGIVPVCGMEENMGRVYDLGIKLAQELLDQGADMILQAAKAQNDAHTPANNPNMPPSKTKVGNENVPQTVGTS